MSVGTFAAAQIIRLVPRVRVSRAVGRLCEAELPAGLSSFASRAYARIYGVNLAEAEDVAQPYRSFDEFFTRRLKPGVREVSPAPIVSPADGRIVSSGTITDGTSLLVKGQPYSVAELTGVDADARRYAAGHFAVVYLSPRDYHRVHSPVDGHISLVNAMDGDLFPVNSIGERHVPGLFVRNQRVSLAIDTPALGRVTAVMVGATIVGRITVSAFSGQPAVGVHHLEPAAAVSKGDEIGIFHLGSTVVLLTEASAPLLAPVGEVLYGQALSGGQDE